MLFPHRSTEYEPSISVTMHRQIVVEIQGRRSWQNQGIGGGGLCGTFLLHRPIVIAMKKKALIGEVKSNANPTVKVGGFAASGVSVKVDLIFF